MERKDIDFESKYESLTARIDLLQKEITLKTDKMEELLRELSQLQKELFVLMNAKKRL